MSAYAVPLFVVLAIFTICAGAVAWWHQRRHIQYLQGLLLHNDQSRRALAEQLLAVRQQIEAAEAPPPGIEDDLAERRRELERLLAAGADLSSTAWEDTRPVETPLWGVDISLSRPAALDEAPTR